VVEGQGFDCVLVRFYYLLEELEFAVLELDLVLVVVVKDLDPVDQQSPILQVFFLFLYKIRAMVKHPLLNSLQLPNNTTKKY
jgi:hypothetical protein